VRNSVISYLHAAGHEALASDLALAAQGEIDDIARRIRDRLPEIELREQKLIDMFDLWADKGDCPKRSFKIALTKYLRICQESLKFNIPSSLRFGEKKHLEEWRAGLEQTALTHMENEVKELSKLFDSSIATQEYSKKFKSHFKTRIGGFARDMRMFYLRDIQPPGLMPEQAKVGKFTVVDDFGTPEIRFEPWVSIIHRATSILAKHGLDYLCYGDLHLGGGGENFSGMYHLDGDYITLSIDEHRARNPGAMLYVLLHELAHRLWYKFLDGGHRNSFSAPWIEQDELISKTYESVRTVLDLPMSERVEGFELAWQSKFNINKFRKWMEGSPERKIRWLHCLKRAYANKDDRFVADEALNPKAFKWAHDNLAKLYADIKAAQDSGNDDELKSAQRSLERWEKRYRSGWTTPQSNLDSDVRYEDVKRAFEPGTGRLGAGPLRGLIQQVLKIHPIKPSVSDYGNQSREEDFAESFAAVLLGTAKDHGVRMRLQRSLPKGTVASVEDATADLVGRFYGVATAGVGEDLETRINDLLSDYDAAKSVKVAEWFERTFRVKSPQTPKGQKDLKRDAVALLWRLGPGAKQASSPENARENIEYDWDKVKGKIPDLVRYFSDEGGKVVPVEIKIGQNTYLNEIGFEQSKFEQHARSLDKLFNTVKGWHRDAFQGGLKVALAGPKAFRGTSAGVYRSANDILYVRATPAVLKRTPGTYASADYIIIHELGHRYERKHHPSQDFDKPEWLTTRYSRKDGEGFAELFALSHFNLTKVGSDDFTGTLARFESVMAGHKPAPEMPEHLRRLSQPGTWSSRAEFAMYLAESGYAEMALELLAADDESEAAYVPADIRDVLATFQHILQRANVKFWESSSDYGYGLWWRRGGKNDGIRIELPDKTIAVDTARVQKWPIAKAKHAIRFLMEHFNLELPKQHQVKTPFWKRMLPLGLSPSLEPQRAVTASFVESP
jgi:hypothetical protein